MLYADSVGVDRELAKVGLDAPTSARRRDARIRSLRHRRMAPSGRAVPIYAGRGGSKLLEPHRTVLHADPLVRDPRRARGLSRLYGAVAAASRHRRVRSSRGRRRRAAPRRSDAAGAGHAGPPPATCRCGAGLVAVALGRPPAAGDPPNPRRARRRQRPAAAPQPRRVPRLLDRFEAPIPRSCRARPAFTSVGALTATQPTTSAGPRSTPTSPGWSNRPPTSCAGGVPPHRRLRDPARHLGGARPRRSARRRRRRGDRPDPTRYAPT